jgi:methylase of polypeptide subunit release factors
MHSILASDHCKQVVSVDISPRAIDFARFNCALNGIDNIEFVLGDVFDSVASTCDLLLSNPPYAPDSGSRVGDNFWSGGPNGTEVLERIIRAIPSRLDDDGACHIVSLFANPPGTRTQDLFDRWLGGRMDRYRVLDYTWPVPRYRDLLSDLPYAGDKSAWRFGVISLCRAVDGGGWWRETGGNGCFFRSDGLPNFGLGEDALRELPLACK